MKNALLTIGVVAALALGFVGLNSNEVFEIPSSETKAVSGPAFSGRWMSVGSLRTESIKIPLLTASTTLCNIATPTASSTVENFALDLDTGTTSASHIQLASAATPDATTTILAQFSLPANGINQIAATSTLAHQIIPGNSFLVVKASPTLGTASAGTVSNTGSCSAEFKVIDY